MSRSILIFNTHAYTHICKPIKIHSLIYTYIHTIHVWLFFSFLFHSLLKHVSFLVFLPFFNGSADTIIGIMLDKLVYIVSVNNDGNDLRCESRVR